MGRLGALVVRHVLISSLPLLGLCQDPVASPGWLGLTSGSRDATAVLSMLARVHAVTIRHVSSNARTFGCSVGESPFSHTLRATCHRIYWNGGFIRPLLPRGLGLRS